jgi:PKD repeat protein
MICVQLMGEFHEEDRTMQLMLAAVAASCVLAVGTMTAAAESPGFTATPVLGTAPLAVRFTVGGQPGRYRIDFGDGSSQASLDTVLSQPWITHSYAVPGTYTATLFATANGDAQAVATLAIAVTDLRK